MERKIYKIDFDKMGDDYEHDGDYYGEVESWISLGFKVQLIDRTEDGVPVYKVVGELDDRRIIRLLNSADSCGIENLELALEMYDRLNSEKVYMKYKDMFDKIDDYYENDYGWNPEVKRPKFELFKKEVKVETKKKDINEIVVPGKKGITNAQLIPALKRLISENNIEDIKFIKNEIMDIYESSFKYLSKKNQQFLNNI